MTNEVLKNKTERYLQGKSLPAEQRQIQTWLSVTKQSKTNDDEERARIEQEILAEVQGYTAYPLFHPKPEPWWKKVTTFFQ